MPDFPPEVSGAYTEGARVYRSSNQSVPNGTHTVITYDSERWDTDNIHSTVSNTGRLTCKTAGKYMIVFSALFSANANGKRQYNIRLNGTTWIAITRTGLDSDNHTQPISSTIYDLAVNDYVESLAYQNSGGALDIIYGAQATPEFMMQRIG